MGEKLKPKLTEIDDLLADVGSPAQGGVDLSSIDNLLSDVQSGLRDTKINMASWSLERRRKEAADSRDESVLNALSMDEELVVRALALCNPNTPTNSLRRRVEQGATPYELMLIAHNPQSTSDLLVRIIGLTRKKEVLEAVMRNKNASEVAIRIINATGATSESAYGGGSVRWNNGIDAPQGEADDLKKIAGISPRLEQKLNDIGIFHIWQIAQLKPAELPILDRTLRLRGQMEKDDWVGQAKKLVVT